jgi:small subunit ribosomal protein S20
MANIKSAKKRIRQTERRSTVNRARLTRLKTFVKNVETAIAAGDANAAKAALKEAEPVIARAGQNNVIHRNTASRKLSRLSARIKVLEASA